MENGSHSATQWGVHGFNYSPSSVLSAISSELDPTPDSSVSTNAYFEDICQETMHYETTRPTRSTVTGLRDDVAAHGDFSDELNRRCRAPECEDARFSSIKELRRHAKGHSLNAKLWYCGCCQNLGHPYQGKYRKDKVQAHLRSMHEAPKSRDKKKNNSLDCQVSGCDTLFTTPSCLDRHLRQQHPSHTWNILSPPIDGITCKCTQKAESGTLQNGHQAETNKHRAGSPLGSKAKRGKYEVVPGPLELLPQSAGSWQLPMTMTNSVVGMESNELPWWDTAGFPNYTNEAKDLSWGAMASHKPTDSCRAIIDVELPLSTQPVNIYQGMGNAYPFPDVAPKAPFIQTAVHQLILKNSKPTDFLAVRRTKDFQTWVSNLRTANDGYLGAFASSIAYNPEKETITLTGFSITTIEQAKEKLQNLLANFSNGWGGNYLLKSNSDLQSERPRSPACMLNSSNAHNINNSGLARIFPIKPKENRKLVGVWYKRILPALPKILSPRIGGTYTASLVRRGQVDITAEPCIQIESPCIPRPEARNIIKTLLSDLYDDDSHRRIRVHFSVGSVKKLNGGEEEEDDDNVARESVECCRLRFNHARPFSKPRMGASLGLLCSKKVVATLGGYVLVNGEKHMLTSEHFVEESQAPANIDGDDSDLETLTSPSRFDLIWMENDLKQSIRDLTSEIDMRVRNNCGDQDVPIDNLSDQGFLTDEIRQKIEEIDGVRTLIGQVKKQPKEYAIGSVSKRSLEPRVAAIATSLADIARLENNQRFATYHMDWSLCKLNSHTAQTAENRHKYRSNQDAMADHYIEEREHASRSGDVCHQTCPVESGIEVYYVGQGSKHRNGVVNIPSLVSRDSTVTYDWGIMNPDGQKLPYSHVAGDSGAWVIRKNGNMLMGQIHSHSSDQVLFTPIDVIFDDLAKACGVTVSLPPCPPGPEPAGITKNVIPLCSIPRTPPIRSCYYLKPPPMVTATSPDKSLIETSLSETVILGISSKIASENETNSSCGPGFSSSSCDSPSSLPSLMDSAISTSGSPLSSQPFECTDLSDGEGEIKKLLSNAPPIIESELSLFEVPYLALDEHDEVQTVELAPQTFQFKAQLHLQVTSSARAFTWPTDCKSRVAKARLGFGISRLQSSRDHKMPGSPCSFSGLSSQFSRRIDDVSNIETLSGSLNANQHATRASRC